MGLTLFVLPCVELHPRQLHLLAIPQDGKICAVRPGAHQLVQDIIGHKAAAAVHRQNLVPRLQAGLPAEGTVLNGVDGLAGDGLILGGDQNHQYHKAQHEIHGSTGHHDQCPLANRCFIQGDAGGLHRCFRLRGGLLLHSMGSFCLLAFGAFLPFQRYKATHRQGTQTVLGAFMILFPEHRPHADGKLVDLNAAELCHGKVPEFMNGDHSAEHDQCGDQGDKN